jgi:glycosyltransferase involved in cell wall biosynthesis
MKIAIVHDWMTGFAGGEQVVLALHRMYPDAPIYTSLYNPEKMRQFANASVIPSYLQKIPYILKKDKLAIPLMPAAFESFDLKGFDVIVSSGAISKGVITHPGQLHINYCHTPIRYVWNLGGDNRNKGKWDSWLREPQNHKLRLWDVVSSERVDTFLANSTTVQSRIAKIYRRDSEVVYPPVELDRYAVSSNDGGYYLMVSRLVAYKRPDILIEACKQLGRPLKIVGVGPEETNLRALAAGAPNIEFLGRVSDEERDALYTNAKAFVFAAEEDFGIVPVEAMACGKPVICYAKGGQTDAVIDGVCGVHFAEQTGASVAEAIAKFELLAFDPATIRTNAERFSMAAFQKRMKELIEFQS